MDVPQPAPALRERAHSASKGSGWGSIEEQKLIIQDILYQFMYSGDVAEAMAVVRQKKIIEGVELTKRALIFGIERQAFEREQVSQLLSQAYNLFGGGEIRDGFQLMLYRLPDLVLDVPDAPALLAKFISRAIYDDVVPPAFIKDAIVDNPHAKETMALAFAVTHSTEEQSRIEHIWGPGDLSSVESLKKAVDAILVEFLENPDTQAATSSVQELNVPSFAGQIVKRGLVKALEQNTPESRTNIINLYSFWHKTNVMTDGSMKRGFGAAWRQMDDIKLDVPSAPAAMAELQTLAIEKKLLPVDFKPLIE